MVQDHAADDIGAEPHLRRRIRQRDAHGIGARCRVGLGRNIAHLAGRPDFGVADQIDFYSRVLLCVFESPLGDIEHCLTLPGLCQSDDHLSGADNLPRIRPDGGNHPVIICFQIGVAEIFARLDLPGARGIEPRLRRLEDLERLIVRHLGREAVLQQLALAVLLRLAPRHLGFGDGDLGFCDFKFLTVLLRVEASEEIALLYLGPDVNRSFEDLAVDPKADIGLIARLDLAGQRHPLAPFLHFYTDGAYGSNDRRRGFLFFLAGRQNQHQNESTDRSRRKRWRSGKGIIHRTYSTDHRHTIRSRFVGPAGSAEVCRGGAITMALI